MSAAYRLITARLQCGLQSIGRGTKLLVSYCFIIYLQTARKLEVNERTRSAELIPLGVGRYTVHMVLPYRQKPTGNMVDYLAAYRRLPGLSTTSCSPLSTLPLCPSGSEEIPKDVSLQYRLSGHHPDVLAHRPTVYDSGTHY
jgi:hypothetical protein